MSNRAMSLSDKIAMNDMQGSDKMFYRTEVTGGYDPYVDKNGNTQFGEVLFSTHNMIVYGGSLFTLQKIFGIPNDNPFNTGYIEDSDHYKLPASIGGTPPFADTNVCLFGIGTNGAGDSYTDVYEVKYGDKNLTPPTGDNVDIMPLIPFRRTEENFLTSNDNNKYWFMKSGVTRANSTGINTTKNEYYLKLIDSKEIKVLDGSGTQIENEADLSSNSSSVDTFVELILKINSLDEVSGDVKEFFNDTGNIEHARFNTIGLFTGVKVPVGTDSDGRTEYDYRHVRLFSRLNIPNEVLVSSKELTISYKIYTT